MGVVDGNDFNYDFHVSFRPERTAKGKVEYNHELIDTSMDELPGHSVFARDEAGDIFQTHPVMAAAPRKISSPTSCSTSPPRDATKGRMAT